MTQQEPDPVFFRPESGRPIAFRGMVSSNEQLEIYRRASDVLNKAAGQDLYVLELHPEQTSFTGEPLEGDSHCRIVVVGDWLDNPHRDLSSWWAKVRELRQTKSGT